MNDSPPPAQKSLFRRCLPWLGGIALIFLFAFAWLIRTFLPIAYADKDAVTVKQIGLHIHQGYFGDGLAPHMPAKFSDLKVPEELCHSGFSSSRTGGLAAIDRGEGDFIYLAAGQEWAKINNPATVILISRPGLWDRWWMPEKYRGIVFALFGDGHREELRFPVGMDAGAVIAELKKQGRLPPEPLTESNSMLVIRLHGRTEGGRGMPDPLELRLAAPYGFLIINGQKPDSAEYFFYDRARRKILRSASPEPMLTALRALPKGSVVDRIDKCTAPFLYQPGPKTAAAVAAVESLLKERKLEVLGGMNDDGRHLGICNCGHRKMEFLGELSP
ncbi:MAG: hypothetical protein RL095_920 [Verrucomicrobiota bacterium]|jgi:hypothetical protein